MKTPIYHPNINNLNGHICIHILNEWKNEYNMADIAFSIYYLLMYPNLESSYQPMNISKAKEFKQKYAAQAVNQYFGYYISNKSWDKGWDL